MWKAESVFVPTGCLVGGEVLNVRAGMEFGYGRGWSPRSISRLWLL